jgi:hypothetical protein
MSVTVDTPESAPLGGEGGTRLLVRGRSRGLFGDTRNPDRSSGSRHVRMRQSRRVMSQRYGESRRWDGDDVDDSVGAQSIVQS